MLKKFSFMTLILSMTVFFLFQNFEKFYSLNNNYFFLAMMENLKFSFILDTSTLSFFFMVMVVTSMVSLYSELYMEHYNNKKFFLMMLLFFFSMIFLSMSKSFMNLMIGWDLLGLTSICLIMFYPNKLTLNNSMLTMFFNRLGDVILILIMSFLFFNYSSFYFFLSEFSILLMVMIIFCSSSKSAQFPLSSWLPAAMAAPTPISAMVHSSTLVTAGIFFSHKISSYMMALNLMEIFCSFSILTFLLGGMLALMELDFKKIVAFSTMSQISMILTFCFLNFLTLMMVHMIFHSLFKTLLFCCSGMFFIFNYSDQVYKFMKNSDMMTKTLFFFSIYSMSGLIFCASFYTKDLILEEMCGLSEVWYSLILLGGILTLFYSSKLMHVCYDWVGKFKLYSLKNSYFTFLIIFSIMMMYPDKILSTFLFLYFEPSIDSMDLMMMLVLVYSFLFLNQNKLKFSNFMLNFMQDIAFMKSHTFSASLTNFKYFKMCSFNDEMFFKPLYFNLYQFKFLKSKIYKKSNFFSIFMVLSLTMEWLNY